MNAHVQFVAPFRRLYIGSKQDLYCLIDEQDYEWARQWNWNPITKPPHRDVYVRRNVGKERQTIYLHRELQKIVEPPSCLLFEIMNVVDHINGQTLDCRRCNLRWATKPENGRNTHRHRRVASLAEIEASALVQPIEEIPF